VTVVYYRQGVSTNNSIGHLVFDVH